MNTAWPRTNSIQANRTDTITVGPVAEQWLGWDEPTATVHSVFDDVINFRSASGTLISLTGPSIPDTPFAIRVEEVPSNTPAPGQIVSQDDNTLAAIDGSWSVPLESIQPWAGFDTFGRFREPEVLEAAARNLQSILANLSQPAGLGELVGEAPSGEWRRPPSETNTSPLIRQARTCMQAIVDGPEGRKVDSTLDGIAHLTGLGPGLTPSGDDAVLGIIGAWSTVQPMLDNGLTKTLVGRIPAVTRDKTSWFSNQWIRTAADQTFSRPVVDLLRSLTTGSDRKIIRLAVQNLKQYGATSGVDLSVGILIGMQHILARIN